MSLRTECPVCGRFDHFNGHFWRIPFSAIDQVDINGFGVTRLPTVDPHQEATDWAQCSECETIYLVNLPDHLVHNNDHYIKKMQNPDNWEGYRRRWAFCEKYAKETRCMIDAAAGVGQYAQIAKRAGWSQAVAMEGNPRYVAWMRSHDIDGRAADLESLNVATFSDWWDCANLVVFSEAFEHMAQPLIAMEHLVSMLAPGGLLFWTVQTVDPKLPIRPAETIYVPESAIGLIHGRTRLREVVRVRHPGRLWIISEEKT